MVVRLKKGGSVDLRMLCYNTDRADECINCVRNPGLYSQHGKGRGGCQRPDGLVDSARENVRRNEPNLDERSVEFWRLVAYILAMNVAELESGERRWG